MAVYLNNREDSEYKTTLRNTPEKVQRFFDKLQARYPEYAIRTIYEVGPTGFVLYHQLQSLHMHCVVAAPSLLTRQPGNRQKTNKRDARSLARALRSKMVTACHIPLPHDEEVRDYLPYGSRCKGLTEQDK